LSVEGWSLTDELIVSLGSRLLNVDLLSTDPHWLLLLIGLLLLRKEPYTWLWCGGLYRDCWDG
jgi:hypothetical protein